MLEKATGTNFLSEIDVLNDIFAFASKDEFKLGLTYVEMFGDLAISFTSTADVCNADC